MKMDKIGFIHVRNTDNEGKIMGRGGKTFAYEVKDGKVIKVAAASCHDKDNFCKKTGRIKAEGRLKSAYYSKEVLPPETEESFRRNTYEYWQEIAKKHS